MGIDEEVRVYEPVVHHDERGSFYESYNKTAFDAWVGRDVRFVQDNHSVSAYGVLRGLHYQLEPEAQAKLVRASCGSIFDVAVDIRRSSPTFGEWRGFELSAENHRQLWIPEGFAHGFLALDDGAEVQYKTSAGYAPALDRVIRWDDPSIGIGWPLGRGQPIVGERDAEAPTLADSEIFA
ncbi:MAG TPA: dTDP-4-dehydrorhamnose 3,5-epimerase [Acidimicrobiia bacterium]|nr:dTDP-4-dehydrorhamnose 3,5-epimerase [Acidimicrobiia bacterium]